MKNNILVAINDSVSFRKALEYILHFEVISRDARLMLLHVFRKPAAGDALMGQTFMGRQPERYRQYLEAVRERFAEKGYDPALIDISITTDAYETVTDGIIDQFGKGDYNMVVLGRKRKSKAEEFVLGDVGVKLVRALEGVAILVIKA